MGTSINQLTSSHSRSKVGRRGEPGKDFPIINTIPKTSFDCKDHIGGSGFYADPETGCQVWHMCQGHRKHSFLCPNGTIFNQKSGVCDWWYNVDCEEPVTLLTVPSESTIRQTRRSGSSSLFESVLMDRKRNFYHWVRNKKKKKKWIHQTKKNEINVYIFIVITENWSSPNQWCQSKTIKDNPVD